MIKRQFKGCAYGVQLDADLPMWGLASSSESLPQIRIRVGHTAPRDTPSTVLPGFCCGPGWAWMNVSGIGQLLAVDGKKLLYKRAVGCDEDALVNYLLGCGLSAVLQQRGGLVLTGSAVVFGGKAYLLLGRGAVGKSTLSASLVQSGCSLLSDEIVHVRINKGGRLVALPGLSTIKLWPESMDYVRRWWGGAVKVRQGHQKLLCDATEHQYCESAPVAGIWHLKQDRSRALASCQLRGKDRIQALAACSSSLIHPPCTREMGLRFRLLAMLASVERFEELRRNIKFAALEDAHEMLFTQICGN